MYWTFRPDLHNQLVAFTVYVQNFYCGLVFEVFTQFGNVNVHASGIEVVVVHPNGFQGKITLQYFVGVVAEQFEELRLLGGQFYHFLPIDQLLLLGVEFVLANLKYILSSKCTLGTAQNGFDTEQKRSEERRVGKEWRSRWSQ